MFTRRHVLKLIGTSGLASAGFGGYALAEPFRDIVTRYEVAPRGWPAGLNLRLAILADIHACDPWVSAGRIDELVEITNAMEPDAVLLLGDFVAGHRIARLGQPVPHKVWARSLSRLKARFGIHAVLGNHDWWEDRDVQRRRKGPIPAGLALEDAGIPVYENRAVRMMKNGQAFWLAGLGDQWAFWPNPEHYKDFKRSGKMRYTGVHDLPGTLASVTDDAPVILMVHEPDIFAEVPERVALTVCGHTHGGQVRFFGYAPVVPSIFHNRYAYGHIVEGNRQMIVSAGLGVSGLPIRFGAPPEIVLVELSAGLAA